MVPCKIVVHILNQHVLTLPCPSFSPHFSERDFHSCTRAWPPPACPAEHHQRAGRNLPAMWPPREPHDRVRSTPSASLTRAGLSPSLSGAPWESWSEEAPHGITPGTGSAPSVSAPPPHGYGLKQKQALEKQISLVIHSGMDFLLFFCCWNQGED